MTTTSRRKYLYVPLQIVDVCAPLSLSRFNFYVSKRILWLKSLDITGLKSCVTVLLTVMRTNVLVLVCFIAGIAPNVSIRVILWRISPFCLIIWVFFRGIHATPARLSESITLVWANSAVVEEKCNRMKL